ncbi:CAP domain-containing protein [Nonomuraea sp. NPDC000554]|uniref:CAP domain-containing protein n=1 Tax=Nonomuraea sp. NPDC000554 TaxID=3154259 RepID=UPI0033279079
MRRQLQVLACLGSLAAVSIPAPAAQAATSSCRVVAAKPSLDSKGMVAGAATRVGCDGQARLRVRVMKAVPGPDRAVKSGSKTITNGRIVARVRCTDTPHRYYVVALDSKGGSSRSGAVTLSCESPTTETPTPTPTPTATATGTGSSVEDTVVQLTNQARAEKGCKPLVHDPKLRAAAQGHSADMAAKGYFDHTAPDGRSPGDRIKAAGFAPISTWGENIAMGQRTADAVVQGWLNSPGHRANIMNCAFTHIGVGYHAKGPHWTQVFAAH